MKVSDYAVLYNVHPNTVRNWAKKGLIQAKYSQKATKRRYIIDVNGIAPYLKPGPRIDPPADDDPPWDQVSINEIIDSLNNA